VFSACDADRKSKYHFDPPPKHTPSTYKMLGPATDRLHHAVPPCQSSLCRRITDSAAARGRQRDLHSLALHPIDQDVVRMHNGLARAGCPAGPVEERVIGQPLRAGFDRLPQARRGGLVPLGE